MGGASVYIISCLPLHLRFLLFGDELPSSLTLFTDARIRVETPQAAALGPRSDQLEDSVIPCNRPTSIQIASQKSKFPRRCCKCRTVIVRRACLPCTRMTLMLSVSCLGKFHADIALNGTDCSHCESFNLASLCSRIAFFSESKMLANEEASLDSASLRDLRSATDLALCTTKATAQAIGRSMSSLIVLDHHLWLTMTEMKEADKVPFLDTPVSSGSLFGPAVEGFAERSTESQKSSQAMRHFLPKHTSSSSASSRPRPAPTQQIAKPTTTALEPQPPEGRRDRERSCSAQCYPFPKRRGPRPKIALDPAPQKSSWTARKKEEGPESRYRCYRWTTEQAASILPLATPLSDGCRGKFVFGSPRAHFSAHVSDLFDSGQNITHTFSKREQKYFSAYHKRPALMQPVFTTV